MHNAIVTGGTRGLGLGIARTLVAAGYRVIAVARRQNDCFIKAVEETAAAGTGELHFAECDLAQLEKLPALIKAIRKQHGSIYALVNNAGISFDGALTLMHPPEIEHLIRVNTVAPILLTRAALGVMLANGGGRIVNISSVTAFTGYSGLSVYSATKSSLVGFSRALAREVGRMGITVNCVAPGFVETDMTSSMNEEDRERIERRSAMRRLIRPDDVAGAVEYLLSDKGKNITGTTIIVDAGNTA
jgi:3-oxoacyl-[acyl-carrier protein] reductase